ncbi:MAG TPA: tRNA (adenosine(37)-N6)-threonylcarbamoyltransferase complex ATPase subunit type 1 TsaE [Candidatus Eremiobacteraceae bacterium]|nr:tRNA (adenosine(37)-N6)-threonylcarbamoyltransferase complex ATPase subunit type 1 TsaE [Candidatus Eremiobacteraceae bacterium]
MTRPLPDANATRRLGEELARIARPGLIVLLNGPLGAGKTTLVQGFAAGIGAVQPAASPSFVLAHNYSGGRLAVWHLDLYRIEKDAEIDDLDIDFYLPRDGVTFIEWAVRAQERWPLDSLEIGLDLAPVGRQATITCFDTGRGIAIEAFRALDSQ